MPTLPLSRLVATQVFGCTALCPSSAALRTLIRGTKVNALLATTHHLDSVHSTQRVAVPFGSRLPLSRSSRSAQTSVFASASMPQSCRAARSFWSWSSKDEHSEQINKEKQVIENLSIKEIKNELQALGISYSDIFEKHDFVTRLAEARIKAQQGLPEGLEGLKEQIGKQAAGPKIYSQKPRGAKKGDVSVETKAQTPVGPQDPDPSSHSGAEQGGGFGGMGGMFGNMFGANKDAMIKEFAQKLMSNPEAMKIMMDAAKNPRIMAAMAEIMKNPVSLTKYASDPDVMKLVQEIRKHLS